MERDKHGKTWVEHPFLHKNPNNLEPLYDIDLYETLIQMYANILDVNGLNVKDYTTAETLFLNTTKRSNAVLDPVHKTYIFFTRPRINFTNITELAKIGPFYDALRSDFGKSLLACLQYPRREYMPSLDDRNIGRPVRIPQRMCPEGPFIPLLTNRAVNSDAMPNMELGEHETNPNRLGLSQFYPLANQTFDGPGNFTVSFKDINNLPVWALHYYWVLAINAYCLGKLTPSIDTIRSRELDFTSSIYIFVTGPDGRSLRGYARLKGVYPVITTNDFIKHDSEYSMSDEISINYRYAGAEILNRQILYDFNALTIPYTFKYKTNDGQYIDLPDIIDARTNSSATQKLLMQWDYLIHLVIKMHHFS